MPKQIKRFYLPPKDLQDALHRYLQENNLGLEHIVLEHTRLMECRNDPRKILLFLCHTINDRPKVVTSCVTSFALVSDSRDLPSLIEDSINSWDVRWSGMVQVDGDFIWLGIGGVVGRSR